MSLQIIPFGARVFVDLIDPVDEVSARAAAAGLHVVILDENVPRATSGRVIAVGDDPFIQARVKVNDVVTFAKYAGHDQMVEGRTYRSIEDREIIAVIRRVTEADGPEQPTRPPVQEIQSDENR